MAFPQVASKITEYKTYLQYTRKVVADLEKNRDKVVDHIHEATEDIQSMEASIRVLEDHRDKFVKSAEHVSKSSATEEDVTLLEANRPKAKDRRQKTEAQSPKAEDRRPNTNPSNHIKAQAKPIRRVGLVPLAPQIRRVGVVS